MKGYCLVMGLNGNLLWGDYYKLWRIGLLVGIWDYTYNGLYAIDWFTLDVETDEGSAM